MVQYQISMDTVAGKVKYKNKIEIKNEQIKFNKHFKEWGKHCYSLIYNE